MLLLTLLILGAPARIVVVGVDGLRPDATRFALPTLQQLSAEGVSTELIPASPTKTFPNLWSLATGLEPAEHGIVDNRLKRQKGATQDPRFFKGEPLWKAVPDSAVIMWLGAEAIKPKTLVPFDKKVGTQARADRALELIPAHSLTMVYFDAVDQAAHAHGWASAETRAAARDVDAAIGRIVKSTSDAAVIVVSDHGMTDAIGHVDVERLGLAFESSGTDVVLQTNDLARLRRETPQLLCREETGAARCQAQDGWVVGREDRGIHGYDASNPAMWGAFFAAGPGIPRGRLAPFRNTELKTLVLALLEGRATWALQPSPAIAHRVFIPGYKGSALHTPSGERVYLTFWQGLGLSTPSLAWPSQLVPAGPLTKIAWQAIYSPWLDVLAKHPHSIFAYDWRRDNLDTLDLLIEHIRAQPKPVELIGHSMGGLLALAAAHKLGGDVAQVSIVGSPVRGGLGFLRDLTEGVAVGYNKKLISAAVAATFESVWCFFPLATTGRMFDTDGQEVPTDFYATETWRHLGLAEPPKLDRARAFRALFEQPVPQPVRVVYSRAVPTLGQAVRTPSGVVLDTRPVVPGDGRVSALDALPARFDALFESTHEHSDLLSDPEVQAWLLR